MKQPKLKPNRCWINVPLPLNLDTLPPNPDGLNGRRAYFAALTLDAFQHHTGADLEDALSDLLADLMHWCDRFNLRFFPELRRAFRHYRAETTAPGQTGAAQRQQP